MAGEGSGRWPSPLRAGDLVRVAFPSSFVDEQKKLQAGVAKLRAWGLTVEEPEAWDRNWNGLAGTDLQRLRDFQPSSILSAGDGPTSQETETAVLWACARGGWGSARLLESGWEPPLGWLLGFSDISSLQWSLVKKRRSGAAAIHGPLITTLSSEPEWSQQRLRQLLMGRPVPSIQGRPWAPGVTTGPLLAGNLTVTTHLIGTDHMPSLRGAVVVFEDVGEPAYKVDRMLTHWRLSGLLQQLGAIGFGRFSQRGAADDKEQRELEAVLRERTSDLGVPVVGGLPVGHGCGGNAALPLGCIACLNGSTGELSIEQNPSPA